MNIVSVITARGNSKGIPLKNIIDIKNKPLIFYAINASLKSNADETWVSTDNQEIKNISLSYGSRVLDRPQELADDSIMPDESLMHFTEHVEFNWLVFIQPTSPMIKAEYINEGIEMMKTGDYDSVFTVTKEHWMPRWSENVEPIDWDIGNRPRRQDRSSTYVENGMFYITTKEQLSKTRLRYGGRIGFVEIPLFNSFQIDNIEDLNLVRALL